MDSAKVAKEKGRNMTDRDDLRWVSRRGSIGTLAYGALCILDLAPWSSYGLLGATLLSIAIFGAIVYAREDIRR